MSNSSNNFPFSIISLSYDFTHNEHTRFAFELVLASSLYHHEVHRHQMRPPGAVVAVDTAREKSPHAFVKGIA